MVKKRKGARKFLKDLVGSVIIRTQPTERKDWTFTDTPILLEGINDEGCIEYSHVGILSQTFEKHKFTLTAGFTDRNWILYETAIEPGENKLNRWQGKQIRRIRPTLSMKDESYMCKDDQEIAPILKCASKYHMVILEPADSEEEGMRETILNSDFNRSEDWVLAK